MTTETTQKQSLVDEIQENVRRDRQRLEKLQDRILSSLEQEPHPDDGEGDEELAPHALAAIAEGVARIADSLSRSNSQLVEIAKLQARESPPAKQGDGFSDEENNALFSQIEREKRKDESPGA